jgi:hypothetical protein
MRVAAVVAMGAIALAGCSGDGGGNEGAAAGDSAGSAKVNTFEGQTPAQIMATAKTAAQDAKSVHMVGDFEEAGGSAKIDMRLSDGGGTLGSIDIGGTKLEIRQVDDVIYVKGGKEMWSSMVPGSPGAADKLAGKWVRVKKGDQAASRFEELISIDKAFEGLLQPGDRKLAKVDGKDVEGTPTIGLSDRTNAEEPATMYIAARGPAYPLLVEPDDGKGQIAFSEWNKEVSVEAPADPVDLSAIVKS